MFPLLQRKTNTEDNSKLNEFKTITQRTLLPKTNNKTHHNNNNDNDNNTDDNHNNNSNST